MKEHIDWEQYGTQVVYTALTGKQAYDILTTSTPDIAILDIRMPGYSGLELSHIISQSKLKTQVIIVSGYAEFSYAQKAIQYGVLGYCLKPVEYDEITSLLLKAVRNLQKQTHFATCLNRRVFTVSAIRILLLPTAQLRTALYRCLAMAYQFFIDADCRLCCHYHDFASLPFMSRLQNALDFGDKLRIDTAKKLLTTTNSSINDVSIQAGFNDYFYFLKTFKKYTGKTPSEFRNEV